MVFNKSEDIDDNRIDWGIIFCVLMLALVGLGSIFVAASHDTSQTSVVKAVVSQLVWYAIGAIAIVVVMQFDSEQLWKLAPYAYWFGIFLLVAVLFLYSRSYEAQTGAKSWFQLGPLTFQPSEIMKPAYILMLAKVIAAHNNEHPIHEPRTDWALLGKMILWTIPIVILLKLQNDFGTTIVFIAILAGMMIVSGVTWKILGPIFGVTGGLGVIALTLAITKEGRALLGNFGFKAYQFARIDTWLHPESDTSNQGFQLWQSMKAVGSGGLSGTGFNVSKVYVPVRESDMIFSVMGENFGFIGGVLLILLYFLLIYEMIKVTFETKNVFYAYISSGVIMMILFHVFENIGMSIGLLPMTGIPLPFVSQGGSALIGNMIGIGLIMSMQYHNKSSMFSTEKNFS
ncbi:rod shape-determining protein RodA [Fructilactobacillus fructivorans]|nr:FtsW/RodA/SpoVE family cell cycle protein [Fructilactobacillus fructivorans]MCT0151238.1 rod shape-determining protein RodA [Fructilactobacillus fructivorans]MCT2867685.1 rod shape-determining protein RodA [Fructilactobacillus fructivorans]MCT2868797.1 rod shape-determining protein RodA [Fructilactobacillus fructivorans]MCT2874033.1 rod shape-determining protein RodA [Fructilactobacillus fructivorans]